MLKIKTDIPKFTKRQKKQMDITAAEIIRKAEEEKPKYIPTYDFGFPKPLCRGLMHKIITES